jgi:hypothetical protein
MIMKNKNQKQPELNNEQIHALMDLPFEYLKARAQEEKVKWDLELSFFVNCWLNLWFTKFWL